jgi:LacI family transcriptional regulator
MPGLAELSLRFTGEAVVPLNLDPMLGQPLYLQIVEQIERAVREGDMGNGEPVWSARKIASHHHISYQTAERALAELARRGVVRRSVAGGTVVSARGGEELPEPRIVHRVIALISAWEVWDTARPTYTMAELAMQQAAAQTLTADFWGVLSVSAGTGDVPGGFSVPRLAEWRRKVNFDGALVFGNMPERGLDWLTDQGYAVVVADAEPKGNYPRVVHDNRGGMRAAVEHLIGLGHRRIAYLRGDRPYHYAERQRAYEEALRDAGIGIDPELIVCVHRPKPLVADALDLWLSMPPGRRPTAIAAGSDLLAASVAQELVSRNIPVPGAVSLTGYDDEPFAPMLHPPLTTLHVSWSDMGRTAAELLVRLLEGDRSPCGGAESEAPCRVTIPARLVERGSTAPPE